MTTPVSRLYRGSALSAQVITQRPYKRCGCGAAYSKAQWDALPSGGQQHTPADDEGPAVTVEMRHCTKCSSTIAVEVKP